MKVQEKELERGIDVESEKEITVLCKDASKRLMNGEATINQIRQEFGLQPIDDKNAEAKFIKVDSHLNKKNEQQELLENNSPCNINILSIGNQKNESSPM